MVDGVANEAGGERPLRALAVGLGPIGVATTRLALSRRSLQVAVSYTHLTLPTILRV